MYPWWGKQFATYLNTPFLFSWRMGFRVSRMLSCILALVHLGPKTTALQMFSSPSTYKGMSCIVERGPVSSLMKILKSTEFGAPRLVDVNFILTYCSFRDTSSTVFFLKWMRYCAMTRLHLYASVIGGNIETQRENLNFIFKMIFIYKQEKINATIYHCIVWSIKKNKNR